MWGYSSLAPELHSGKAPEQRNLVSDGVSGLMQLFPWLGEQPQEPLDGEGPPARVSVHIYDLGQAVAGVNMLCRAVGTGAFHAGVEVYGSEWSFSAYDDGPHGTGIFACPPRACCAHMYRETVEMGSTSMSNEEVNVLLDTLAQEWPGAGYDLLRHNCCHFSDEFCKRLGVGALPSWVTSLAGVGAMLRSGVKLGVRNVKATPRAAVRGMAAAPRLMARGAKGAVGKLQALRARRARGRSKFPVLPPGDSEALRCRMPLSQVSDLGEPGPEWPDVAELPWQPLQSAGPAYASAHEPTSTPSAWQTDGSRAGVAAGDRVAVFDKSQQQWCAGRVESVADGDMVAVAYQQPGAAPGTLALARLPQGHPELRRAEEAGAARPLGVGDFVEVFSNSAQAWCPGFIETVEAGVATLVFQLPGAGPEDWSEKQLPMGNAGFRRISAEALQELDSLDRAGSEGGSWSSELVVGDWVEVFSNSRKAWCLGRVTCAGKDDVTAAFQLPGAGPDEWVEKRLPRSSGELRRPPDVRPPPPPPAVAAWPASSAAAIASSNR